MKFTTLLARSIFHNIADQAQIQSYFHEQSPSATLGIIPVFPETLWNTKETITIHRWREIRTENFFERT